MSCKIYEKIYVAYGKCKDGSTVSTKSFLRDVAKLMFEERYPYADLLYIVSYNKGNVQEIGDIKTHDLPLPGRLEPGDIVNIYEDPVTCKTLEGKAELLELDIRDPEQEYWKVKFIYSGDVVYRWIKGRSR